MRKSHVLVSTFLTSVILSTSAFAQETTTEEDTFSWFAGTRLDTISVTSLRPVVYGDISSSVDLLTADDLSIRNSLSAADQLRAVPGFGISRSGPLGGLTQVRIRGAEANHTLVLINGIEVSDPANGETDFGILAGLPLSRIEVARGEHSALYGSDAIGGVVALETPSAPGLGAEAEIGTQGTVSGGVNYGAELGNTALFGGLSGYQTDGVDTSGRGGEKDGSDALNAILTSQSAFGDTTRLSGLLIWRQSTSQTDPDLDFDGILDNADRETESDQFIIGTTLDTQFLALDHRFTASFNSVERENFADGSYSDKTTGERSKLSWSPAKSFETSAFDLHFAGLIDWEKEDYERRGVASVFGDPNQSESFETLGLVGETRFVIDRLSLNGTIRHDDNDGRFEDFTSWRLGGAFEITSNLVARASAGEGVKNPTFTELFGFYPGSFVGNPDLEPESSQSWEIGFDYGFGPVAGSLTYFEADLENEIYTAYTPTFASTPMNRLGESNRSGVELSSSWQVTEAVSLSGMISNIDSTDDTGTSEIRVAEWTGSLSGRWASQSVPGMSAGLALDYVGDQTDTDFGSFPYQNLKLDEYVLVSGSFEYPIADQLSVTLRGENLLDEKIVDVLGYHAPGAAVFIGLKLR